MMMAMAGPPGSAIFLSLLECLEDSAAGQSEHTDAYLTLAGRLSGEEGRQFLPAVEQHFSRLGKATLTHINSPNVELSQAALQALGFCVYHSRVVIGVPETFLSEILSALCSLVVKSTDKNTCTRALWVISKQSLPPDMVAQKVSSILGTLECVWNREDIQSVLMEHEALNVVIRLLEQVPAQMGDAAVRWAKLLIPQVVHSAAKVRLRAAAALEMGMPLLLKKQSEVSAIIEPMMSSKLIPELQKLFMSKNETNVLKLWPLFVKLLGKLLHRGGPFINSLLHLEELGFRSSSPIIKKIAFIAWKSLIDNFALNPEILCSGKRLKLLMQPLTSINVRTEALLLTKVEVWWYLIVQLGPNLSSNFDQVSVPLLQCTIGSDSSSLPGAPSRAVSQNGAVTPGTPGFNSTANTSRISLNASIQISSPFPSIQLLGLEMLLHYFLGPEVIATAAKNKLILSLEPLNHPLLTSTSSFTKHAAVLTSYISDGFISIGKDASESLLAVIWRSLVCFVNSTIESVGSKKDRHGCEVLTLMLQTLQSIVTSEAVPADKVLILVETTVESIPQRVLGSASYQVGKMDVLNGTPALFLILLLYNSSMLSAYIEDKRFFKCLQTLVGCGLSGPTSPLAFGEAVLEALGHSTGSLQNKEQLWMMWNVVVSPLTERITESNEVNQGDALEHNFSAMHSALLFPITHLLCGTPLQQVTQKTMLSTWSKLYKVFARCSALVITAEENICCEELCSKMTAAIDREALKVPSTLNAIASILQVMVECVDFSPYTSQFQQKLKSPHTPVNWVRRRNKVLGNLSTFQSLLLQCLEVYLEGSEASSEATGLALVSILSVLFTSLALANTVKEALASLTPSLTIFYQQTTSEQPKFTLQLLGKMEKLIGEIFGCLQTRAALAYDDELLALLSPLLCVLFSHNNKQLRASVTQFWNSTFANAVSLTYPDEIRPILSQVKQKTPLILPGFEVVSDELSGQYSSESSQLETKLSGIPFSTVGKRNSLLGKDADLKDKNSMKSPKPVSIKLDFGSPKPPCREFLEEEASIDFVFIPPETKQRILTEHQKEVKRTKRFDIPAMYNNLDASLDTTVFTQYTQSQEDSLDKLHTEHFEKVTEGAPDKVPQIDVENEEDGEVLTKETQYYVSPKAVANMRENPEQEMAPESAAVSTEDNKSDNEAEDMNLQSKEGTSPNISCYSDLVLGTPQKPNSRRQSFITLEKYPEGKPASPGHVSTFTVPLIKTTNSQECSNTSNTCSSFAYHNSNISNSLSTETGKIMSPNPGNNAPVSPLRTKDSGSKFEPVRLTDRMPSDTSEDSAIPDTQTEVEEKECKKMASTLKELKPLSQEEEESQQTVDNSETSVTQTFPGEPRRSGRCRVRPLLPGEDPEEREEKYIQFKRRSSGEDFKIDSPKQSGPKTRSRQAAEETTGKARLRRSGLRDRSESSQNTSPGRAYEIKLYSNSEGFLEGPGPTRSTRESSQTELHSDCESQSLGRYSRRSKASLDTEKEGGLKRNILTGNKESSQTATELVEQTAQDDDEPKRDSQKINPSAQNSGKSKGFEIVEQAEKDEKLNEDSQMITCSPQTVFRNQECALIKNTKRDQDSQIVSSSPTIHKSLDRKSLTNRLKSESEVRDRHKKIVGTDDNLSQEDSQVNTVSSSESQFLRRSRRSKALSETAESEEESKNKVSSQRRSRSNLQTLPAVGLSESTIVGRTRRSNTQEVHTKSSPLSTPESSQSQNVAESKKLSQGRGRYSRRRSSQALVANVESSESESSQARENVPLPKTRGRKPQASRQSLPNLEPKDNMNTDTVKNDCDTSQADVQNCKNATNLEDHWQKKKDLQCSDSLKVTHDIEDQSNEGSQTEVESGAGVVKADSENTNKSQLLCVSPHKEKQMQENSNIDNKCLKETETRDLQTAERFKSEGINAKLSQEKVRCDPSWLSGEDALSAAPDTTEILQCSQEKTEKVPEPGDSFREKQNNRSDHQEYQVFQVENIVEGSHCISFGENQMEHLNAIDYLKEEEITASNKEVKTPNQHSEAIDVTPLQEIDKESKIQTVECQDDEEIPSTSTENSMDVAVPDLGTASVSKELVQGSPVKQKDLETVTGPDFEQSPSSSRTRGAWSPSASPSTSILKKAQKRPLEDETPSPLVKSRRVSFADPIQHQETADDIDRRSPAVRTSSPRRSKNGNIPQPKYITTPTKGLLILSPRNLHTPGYKSSKKCLISEMNQEQRPVSRDCIYPALVGCSAPVEAVLPQISSNMWSRGFGQLVRARNIKTVGDLSALTPSEIKTLPIRLPKISNVKKALNIYEQQRKGRGGDELKSLDETEMMTSELEETSIPQNQDEEDKTSNETLATELSDGSVCVDGRPEQDCSGNENLNTLAGEQRPEGRLHPKVLLPELEALACKMTSLELIYCSAEELVQMHDQFGSMMRRVVVELQRRLCHTDGETLK